MTNETRLRWQIVGMLVLILAWIWGSGVVLGLITR
jgi:hypothetical protein